MPKPSLDEYLARLESMVDDEFGMRMREHFQDIAGSSELAMLECPSGDELELIRRAVAIMTPDEKSRADVLMDEEVEKIAKDAMVDQAVFAIFINGYALFCKRVR